jgi:hypothetical protein
MATKAVRLQGKGHDQATPYLREWAPKMLAAGMDRDVHLVDLACGNMRNTKFLWSLGIASEEHGGLALDMQPDAYGSDFWEASQMIPARNEQAGLILCQYLLMFLDDERLHHVLCEIGRIAASGCVLVVELQNVKQGRKLLAAPIFGALCRLSPGDIDWECIHMSKMRFIAQRR